MLIRTTVDIVIDENDPRAMGEAAQLLRDGDFGRYYKPTVNRSSTESDTLRKVRVEVLK